MDFYGNLCEEGPSAETQVTVSKELLGLENWELEGTLTISAAGGVVEFGDLAADNKENMPITDAHLFFNAEGWHKRGVITSPLAAANYSTRSACCPTRPITMPGPPLNFHTILAIIRVIGKPSSP